MRNIHIVRYVCIMMVVFTVLAGCDQPPSENKANLSPSQEIQFAMQNRIGSAIPLIATEKGYFAEAGLNVKALRFNNGPACAEALYSGSADIGTMGDTTAIISLSRTDQLKLLTSHSTGESRHRMIVKADSAYRQLVDLRGKKIAVKKGTSTFGGFLLALKKAGMTIGDVQVVDLSPGTMTEALLAGSVDAMAASEPTPSLAELKGGRQLMTFAGLGNQYPIMTLVRKEFLQSRPNDLSKLMQALGKAEQYLEQHPQDAAEMLSEVTGLPAEIALKAMANHEYRLRLDTEILSSLVDTAKFLHVQGYIDKVPDLQSAEVNLQSL